MEKICLEATREIDGGKTYTATRRCSYCGKKFSASSNYYGWISYASAKFAAQYAVNNKYNSHVVKHF